MAGARLRQSPRGATPQLVREFAYDAGILQRPRVWQRPWFWIAVTGATLPSRAPSSLHVRTGGPTMGF
jgi:hypothetical protein